MENATYKKFSIIVTYKKDGNCYLYYLNTYYA